MIHVEQIKAARALVGWNQLELAKSAGIGLATIRRIEAGKGPLRSNTTTALKIQRALESAGAEFLADNETHGVGVRLRVKSQR